MADIGVANVRYPKALVPSDTACLASAELLFNTLSLGLLAQNCASAAHRVLYMHSAIYTHTSSLAPPTAVPVAPNLYKGSQLRGRS